MRRMPLRHHTAIHRFPACLLLAGVALTAVHGGARSAPADAAAFTPSQGDGRTPAFYSWSGPAPGKPGTMLRSEPLEAALQLPGAATQSRILYSSTSGIDGSQPVAVSGAVFIPAGAAPAGGWPVIAWAHGTVGMADICAPSLLGRSYRDISYLARWLAEGYAIVATDYQGLGTAGPHPYMNSRAAAYSVLDSIRVAQAGFPQLARKTVIVGQSQGGHAAFAAAAFAGAYAPELDLRGTVATGTPYLPDGEGAESFLRDSKPSTDYLFYLLLKAEQGRPAHAVDAVLAKEALPVFSQTRAVCNTRIEFDVMGAGLRPDTAFQPAMLAAALEPSIRALSYPALKIVTPLFLGIGGKDEAVRPSEQLALAQAACQAGTVVEAHLYAGQGHSAAMARSLPDSIPFVRNAFAGIRPTASTCSPEPQ